MEHMPVREDDRSATGPVNAVPTPAGHQRSKDCMGCHGSGVGRGHTIGIVPPTEGMAIVESQRTIELFQLFRCFPDEPHRLLGECRKSHTALLNKLREAHYRGRPPGVAGSPKYHVANWDRPKDCVGVQREWPGAIEAALTAGRRLRCRCDPYLLYHLTVWAWHWTAKGPPYLQEIPRERDPLNAPPSTCFYLSEVQQNTRDALLDNAQDELCGPPRAALAPSGVRLHLSIHSHRRNCRRVCQFHCNQCIRKNWGMSRQLNKDRFRHIRRI